MKKVYTFDTETDPFKYGRVPEPFACGLYSGEWYREFWGDDCIERFVDYLIENEQEFQDAVIYAHNGGKFDFHFLLEYLDEKILVLNGRLSKVYIHGIEFRDSILILPRALSKYKKDEIDYDIFERDERDKYANKKKIQAYLKTDCIYLHEWITKFIDRYGYHLTLPAASFNQLKETGYEPEYTTLAYDDNFRDYYYGGRTEVFREGVILGDNAYVDINSAYPEAMLDYHPFGSRYVELNDPPTDGSMYFATIIAVSYGALPIRTDEGLFFPSDNAPRKFFVTSWEIDAGISTGTLKIIRYERIIKHEKYKHFKEFVLKFYGEKLEAKRLGDKDNESFSKLILTSCYGKFATNCRLFKTYQLVPVGMLPTELVEYYIKYDVKDLAALHKAIIYDENLQDGRAQRLADTITSWKVNCDLACGITIWVRDEPGTRYYNVATAASITGFVRAKLWKAICESERPIYCDTDSIMCKKFNGVIGEKLGQWKVEAILNRIYIGGKKLYAAHIKGSKINDEAGWKTASKGSRLTYDEIISLVVKGTTIKWKNPAPSFSLRYGARFIKRKIKTVTKNFIDKEV